MKSYIFRLCALLLLALPLPADDLPTIVADSGSNEVDTLVAKLVSHRPHPFPPSGPIPKHLLDEDPIFIFGQYITNEVAEAIAKLEQLGPSASPYLLSHLDDNRYSYSTTLSSMLGEDFRGWKMVSVGNIVRDVITGGFESGWLYKWRDGPNDGGFSPPQFSDYLETQGGLKKWVARNSKNSKAKVFSKFIDWCIDTERGRGFGTKDDETKMLARYEEWKKKVEQAAPSNR